MDTEERDYLRQAGAFLRQHDSTITNALNNHGRRMRQSGEEARLGYEQGQADPEIKAHQDASILTNAGWLHSATAFEYEAAKAFSVVDALAELMQQAP